LWKEFVKLAPVGELKARKFLQIYILT